jgi:transposase InsO family protein
MEDIKMPFKETRVMDERIRFVLRALDRDCSFSFLCKEFGISRPTGYLWLRRYREVGSVLSLREHSRRPHHSPRKSPEELEDRVVILRLAYGWGARKLRELLVSEGFTVSESTINRILKSFGLCHEREVSGLATKRFERKSPNQLWQMDFKGPYKISRGHCIPLTILDDHSRYAVGAFALSNQRGSSVRRCLISSFKRYGLPEAMLIDHGVPWWSPNGHGLTWLAVAIIKQGIHLIFSGIRHPQTQGKIERFHRTLDEKIKFWGRPQTLNEWRSTLNSFVEEYNHIRPHDSLDMQVPASRFHPSPHPYQQQPPEWEYPSGAIVKKLNPQGCIDYKRNRYFVSEALAHEYVQLIECNKSILVKFRNMWIREIYLKNGRSVSLIDKNKNPYV